MGFFGGNYSQIPGLGEDLAGFDAFDPRGNMFGANKFEKMNRGALKDASKGQLDRNAYYSSSIVNPIKSSFAANRNVLDRGLMMNPFIVQHPELTAAMKGDYDRDLATQEGNAIGGASSDFLRNAGRDMSDLQHQRRMETLGFNQLDLDRLKSKAQTRQGGTNREASPFSILSGVLGQGLGGLAAMGSKG